MTGKPLPPERLWDKVVERPNGCHEWTGYTNPAGYGRISIKNKPTLTHRLAWELANGPIPDGVLIRHYVCDNPPCCNVEHLRPGTDEDNVADMITKGRRVDGHTARTHCPADHEYTEANTYFWKGHRGCRICRSDAKARYLAKKAS